MTHGVIVNLTTGLPFIFQYNPEEVKTQKPLTWYMAPNIGGSSQESYFAGFQNREISLTLKFIYKKDRFGIREEIEYFKSLGEPAPGILEIASSIFGNENYPPPKVLYQFGVSLIPLVYEVAESPQITIGQFKSDGIEGIIGIPTVAEVGLKLRLDESHILNKAEKIAKQVAVLTGSADSIIKEAAHLATGKRKEASLV